MLATTESHALLLSAWHEADHYLVGRYVIMADHVHLFCAPASWPPEDLPRWVSYWKSIVARRWPQPLGGKLWQRDFWDTQLRQGESYAEKWSYVLNNPVRAKLVTTTDAWPFQGELNVLRWHD